MTMSQTIATNLFSALPTKVQNIASKCISQTTAVVSWLPDLIVVPRQNFTLHYTPKNGTQHNASFKGANQEEDIYVLHVDNLQPATKYIFTISSENYLGRRVSEEVSCITKEEGEIPESPLNETLIGGITMIYIGVLLVAMVIILSLLQRCRKSADNENDCSRHNRFFHGCLPGRKAKSSNHYENTCRESQYENVSKEIGINGQDESTEKYSNNLYEEIQTCNAIKMTETPTDNSKSAVNKQHQGTSVNEKHYVNITVWNKPKPPQKTAKIIQTKT